MINEFDIDEYFGSAVNRMLQDWQCGWFDPRSEADVQGYLYSELINKIRQGDTGSCNVWLEYPYPGSSTKHIDLVAFPTTLAVEVKLLKSRSEQYTNWADRCHEDLRRLARLNHAGWSRCWFLVWDLLGGHVIRDYLVLSDLLIWEDIKRQTDGKETLMCLYRVYHSKVATLTWRGRPFLTREEE